MLCTQLEPQWAQCGEQDLNLPNTPTLRALKQPFCFAHCSVGQKFGEAGWFVWAACGMGRYQPLHLKSGAPVASSSPTGLTLQGIPECPELLEYSGLPSRGWKGACTSYPAEVEAIRPGESQILTWHSFTSPHILSAEAVRGPPGSKGVQEYVTLHGGGTASHTVEEHRQ